MSAASLVMCFLSGNLMQHLIGSFGSSRHDEFSVTLHPIVNQIRNPNKVIGVLDQSGLLDLQWAIENGVSGVMKSN